MNNQNKEMNFHPPITPIEPVIENKHNIQTTDNYQWLEDKNDEAVIRWTAEQHQATLDYVNTYCPPIEGLETQISNFVDRDIKGAIFFRGNHQFFYQRKRGEQQFKLFIILEGQEQLLFDPIAIDDTGQTSISSVSVSHQKDKIAIGCQYKGAEIKTYYVLEIETGKQLFTPISNIRNFGWCRDGNHVYITIGSMDMLEQQIPIRTYHHQLGTSHSEDTFLMAPDDPRYSISIWDAERSDISFISKADFNSNTLHLLPFQNTQKIELFSSEDTSAYPHAIGDTIYFFTNHEAPNFKLMVADKTQASFPHWRVLIPEKKEIVLESFVVTQDYIITQEKKNVLSHLQVYDKTGKSLQQLPLPITGNISYINYHHNSNRVFVSISSFIQPAVIYQLDGNSLEWSIFHERENPFDTSNLTSQLCFFPSKDGTQIPLFLVHDKDLQLDGKNPVLLNAYGGFNIGRYPYFIGSMVPFVQRGGIFALACIRGGNEYGESWHRDGMMYKKQNCFDDFIAAGEYLIGNQYTSPQKLSIKGGSNGGLLIGAVTTQRPDLFQAAICSVPLLDMLRYHRFLIARYWISEYGNPDVEADFRNLLTYSPYHNIRTGINLPTTLFIAGENDTRVDPLHAKKMVAALQNNVGQINPSLLYIDYDSGHGSGKSVQKIIEGIVFEMRFLMHSLEMTT